MLRRMSEYLKYGAGRPLGTIWSMERAYFQLRHQHPGLREEVYLFLSLRSRYPDKPEEQIHQLASECHNLEDAIQKALEFDFSPGIAAVTRVNFLYKLPACTRCHKYRALRTTDSLCYGCREYAGFAACTQCHLFWDNGSTFCARCGGKLWKITDGPGVSIIDMSLFGE